MPSGLSGDGPALPVGLRDTGDEPALPSGLSDDTDEPTLPASLDNDNNTPSLPAGLSDRSDGPSLPTGLDGHTDEPATPSGLGDHPAGPTLPTGLGETPETTASAGGPDDDGWDEPLLFDSLTGFWEVRGGWRSRDDPYQKHAAIGETRLQLSGEKHHEGIIFTLTADFIYDTIPEQCDIDLENGRGWLDLREASVLFSPVSFMDVQLGRQVLTWGTGDLIFINDMFPKDWQSFFAGRDTEYLKAPSDAVKTSLFSDLADVDIVFTPRFDSDRYIDGSRNSYFNAMLDRRAGRDAPVKVDKPDEWGNDHELALRVSRTINGYELAGYGYWGYWKSPGGMDPGTGRAIFPRLNVYGASLRGQFLRGIANLELGYYDSRDDRDGDDPFINNGQWRFLLGYEQDLKEIAEDLTVGVQYYIEWMADYDDYRDTLMAPARAADEDRHVLTLRLTQLLMNQNLILSFFAYASPTDEDAYLRPNIRYKLDDHWQCEMGSNIFLDTEPHTFFGQFERNTNLYASLRYSF